MMRYLTVLFFFFYIATICSAKRGRYFDKKDAKELRAHGPLRRIVYEEPKDLLQRGYPGKPDLTVDVVNRGPPGFERNDDLAIGEERRDPPGIEKRGPPGIERRRPPAGFERRSELFELNGAGKRGPPGFERKKDLQNSGERRLVLGGIEGKREFLELETEKRTGPPGPPDPNEGAMKRDPAGHPGLMDKRLPENLGPPGTGKSMCKVNLPHIINASLHKPRNDLTS